MKDSTKSNIAVTALTLIFIVILLLNSCWDTVIEPSTPAKPTPRGWKLEKFKSDTIWAKDTVYVPKLVPYKVLVHDSVRVPQSILDGLGKPCEYQRTYIDTVKDSNIEIYSTDSVIGVLKNKNVSYKLKVPLTITNDYYYTTKPVFRLYAGIETGIDGTATRLTLKPLIGAQMGNQSLYYSYDPFSKIHSVGYTKDLFTKYSKLPKDKKKK